MAELFGTSLFSDATLKAYYRLEGNSADSKGSNNGTDTAITYGSGYGKYGQGADLNGTSSYISVADHSDLKPTTTYSISMWVKTSTAFRYLFSTANIRTSPNLYEGLLFGTDASGFVYAQHCYTPGASDVSTTTGDINIVTGNWTHVVVTYASNTVKIYVNGVLDISEGSKQDPVYNATNYVDIGARHINGSYDNTSSHAGSIDDLAFWNGKELSLAEVQTLYAGGNAGGGFFMNFV